MITLLKFVVMAIATIVETIFMMDNRSAGNPGARIQLQPIRLDPSKLPGSEPGFDSR
jgi:hypothetical protein